MTHPLSTIDIVGFWIGIFLTFCILSYLYKDNPFYKLAEHLFVGISIGYVVTQQYYNTLKPNLVNHLAEIDHVFDPRLRYLIPLALFVFLFARTVSQRFAWLGTYPVAFVVALYAGIQINGVAQSDLGEQMKSSMQPLTMAQVDINTASAADMASLPGFSPAVAQKVVEERQSGRRFESLDEVGELSGLTPAQRQDLEEQRGHLQGLDAQASVRPGGKYWFGMLSRILLLVGFVASLVYFYFSAEHKGIIGKISRFGVWVLMIGFGASFGYTVQGRLSLAVGRALDVLGKDKDPAQAAQIGGAWVALLSMVIIATGIVVWELRTKKRTNEPQ
jgi:hypothetical protein